MSRTTSTPSLPVLFTASSKSDTSKGQQTASTSAPVAAASRTRTSASRSSACSLTNELFHIPPPPPPQQ
jgi:hypothetical protein